MPVTVYTNINDLVAAIQAAIAPNGTENITGQVHQDILVSSALSLNSIINNIPPSVLNGFSAWNAGTTYTGGSEVVVRHNSKLWLFVSATNNTGTEPGTNSTKWAEISALTLAHFRNQDTHLDQGNANEVTAQDLREHLDDTSIHGAFAGWFRPVSAKLNTPVGGEADGTRVLVGASPTGAFAGWELAYAEKVDGVWTYQATQPGWTARSSSDHTGLWFRTGSDWVFRTVMPTLANVLANGASSGDVLIGAAYGVQTTPMAITHSSPGIWELPTMRSHIRFAVSADLEIQVNAAPLDGVEYVIELVHTAGGAHALVFGGTNLLFDVALAVPTSLATGVTMLMKARRVGSSLCVLYVMEDQQAP